MNMQMVDGIPVDYSGLPERHRETARLYVEHGCTPGSGWEAMLSNDLRAIIMVDAETAADMRQIYRWLVNHAPSRAWGSIERVREWIKAREAERNPQVHSMLRGAVNAAAKYGRPD